MRFTVVAGARSVRTEPGGHRGRNCSGGETADGPPVQVPQLGLPEVTFAEQIPGLTSPHSRHTRSFASYWRGSQRLWPAGPTRARPA
ncbi:hypothetical protein BN2537_16911 [Streptomyces venezuelae]|nr:hypothetical protein BN2537_16911 [Streptomyces venezuelae]